MDPPLRSGGIHNIACPFDRRGLETEKSRRSFEAAVFLAPEGISEPGQSLPRSFPGGIFQPRQI